MVLSFSSMALLSTKGLRDSSWTERLCLTDEGTWGDSMILW